MKRLLAFPALAVFLFAMWILLTGFSPGHILLAAAIALVVPRVMLSLGTEAPRIRSWAAMLKLVGLVVADIIRSNIAVARIVLLDPPGRRSGFILVPSDLRSPWALASLAIIITATPGTIWLQHDARQHRILIHVLDLVDEAEWIALIKNRYERLLMEIFE